ncbi:MAG TPA: hypothetical protein VFA09_22985 [Ktedonobacteraceae bacterium]|nr:hypothetical protein [Ktedonobacteraceae bacterium]
MRGMFILRNKRNHIQNKFPPFIILPESETPVALERGLIEHDEMTRR